MCDLGSGSSDCGVPSLCWSTGCDDGGIGAKSNHPNTPQPCKSTTAAADSQTTPGSCPSSGYLIYSLIQTPLAMVLMMLVAVLCGIVCSARCTKRGGGKELAKKKAKKASKNVQKSNKNKWTLWTHMRVAGLMLAVVCIQPIAAWNLPPAKSDVELPPPTAPLAKEPAFTHHGAQEPLENPRDESPVDTGTSPRFVLDGSESEPATFPFLSSASIRNGKHGRALSECVSCRDLECSPPTS